MLQVTTYQGTLFVGNFW